MMFHREPGNIRLARSAYGQRFFQRMNMWNIVFVEVLKSDGISKALAQRCNYIFNVIKYIKFTLF